MFRDQRLCPLPAGKAPLAPRPEGVLVAGERDLATMKLAAVSQRTAPPELKARPDP